MNFLHCHQSEESDMTTFFVGLFTGSFITLFILYTFLAHLFGVYSTTSTENPIVVYTVFSMLALLSLHIFVYGCNLFIWERTRIDHNFILRFSPSTALKHRDAFLISISIMTVVFVAMLIHLKLQIPDDRTVANTIPIILLALFTGILFFPFDLLYRATRFCFLQTIHSIIFSPFYKVLMVDFFMSDQLTSQIPLLRYMEFTTCYFVAEIFKLNQYKTCTSSQQFKVVTYLGSFLPFYWRAMQCARRYIEEGYGANHLMNAGKYASAMLAAATRVKYIYDPTPLWLAALIIVYTITTVYHLYWDFVKDWGLLNLNPKSPWLRDELILKTKSIYYASIGFNFTLKLMWVVSVLHHHMGMNEHGLIFFILASLEIIRRGNWNFYRLENEQLNNMGKFRKMRGITLSFDETFNKKELEDSMGEEDDMSCP